MKKIIKQRGGGKTTDAVRIADETGAYLVVRNMATATLINQVFKPKRFPITYDELISTRMSGSFVRNIVIDDLDAFTSFLLSGLKIEAITMDAPGN